MLRRQLIFNGLASTWWFVFCLLAVLAAAVLIVMLLRYERRLVPRRVGYALLLLRLAVLAVVLLTLLQPIISWTLDREQTGRVLVAIDLSESMSTVDKHAAKAEKLRWARALGIVGNTATNDRLDRWIKAFEAGREPAWVDDDETADPERRRQLEQDRREYYGRIFEELDKLPRKEIALRLLTGTSFPLLPALQDVVNVELAIFAGKAEAADARTLGRFVEEPPDSLWADATNLGQALSLVQANSDGASVPVGVVLITDGRNNTAGDPLGKAERLGAISVPVYPVMLGSELRPKDLAIASLDYPLTVFKDDKPLLKATLNTSQFEGKEITVVLEHEEAEPLSKTVTPEGPTASVEFELEADEVGRRDYTIRTDVRPGETRDDNNQRSFGMNVVDDKVRVLLVEGEARWEFRFLDNALSRDTRVEVKKVVFQQPYMGVLPEPFFPRTLQLPDDADDLEDSPFAEPDLVILGDVAPEKLPPVAWELLEKYVAESGGTLVLVAGKQYFPLSHKSEVLGRLLPLTELHAEKVTDQKSATVSPVQRGFHLRLTADGEEEPALQFDADRIENRSIWSSLPGHMWGLLGKAKRGASVLAYAVLPGEEPTLEAERQNAVIVHQHYGFGQVLWIGIDSTWRWRHRVGDKYHHRFWGQLGRWAAENKAAAGNEFVKFGPDRTDLDVGQDALIRARWTRQFLRKFPRLKAKAEIYRRDEPVTTKPFSILELNPNKQRPLVYEAPAVSLPAGEYRVKLVVEGTDLATDDIEAMLYVNEAQSLELSDLSSNRELLTQLAGAGNGRLLMPDETRQLPDLFRNPVESSMIRREIELWDHWLVLLLFFALLTTEWVTRKLNGLP